MSMNTSQAAAYLIGVFKKHGLNFKEAVSEVRRPHIILRTSPSIDALVVEFLLDRDEVRYFISSYSMFQEQFHYPIPYGYTPLTRNSKSKLEGQVKRRDYELRVFQAEQVEAQKKFTQLHAALAEIGLSLGKKA